MQFTGVPQNKVDVIYNPVVSLELLAYSPIKGRDLHSYFSLNVPVYVCVGSLTEQKNFSLFLNAFSKVLSTIDAKAIILGEGPKRPELEKELSELGLDESVCLLGFVDNPYDYISNADAFILSSSWEGLPTVLIESLALSTKIVSTNCPSGPEEILNNGEFGVLVNVGDCEGLAVAMIDSLNGPDDHLKKRANDFSVMKSIDNYYDLISK